jgi:hypothetical protein
MAVAYSDGGRQLIYPATEFGTKNTIGPSCNMKIIDAWWQDTATSADTMSFQDAVGRVYAFKASTDLIPIAIGRLDWLEGPITFLQISSGNVYFILGNR